MAAVTLTLAKVAAINTPVSMAVAAATETTADKAEAFELTFSGKTQHVALIFNNANSHGSYTYEIKAGDLAMATAVTGKIEQNKANEIVQIDTGRAIDKDKKITIELTPATGKKLATDHAATLRAVSLL